MTSQHRSFLAVLVGLSIVACTAAACSSAATIQEPGADADDQDTSASYSPDGGDAEQPDGGTDAADAADTPDAAQEDDAPAGTVSFELTNRTSRSVIVYPSPAGLPCSQDRGWLKLSSGAEAWSPATDCSQCACGDANCSQCDILCDNEVVTLHAGQTHRFEWNKFAWTANDAEACVEPRLTVGEEVTAELCWGDSADGDEVVGERCETRVFEVTEEDQTVEVVLDAGQDEWATGDVFFGSDDWLEVRVGDLPLVISAPHGGSIAPSAIPNRSCPNITTVTDLRTSELAVAVEDRLRSELGATPTLVVAHIRRTKVDLNRDRDEATCGNARMGEVWAEYHQYIETALARAIDQFGYAIYIDLHGHGHEKQRLELGYSRSKASIRTSHEDAAEAERLGRGSSLRNLIALSGLSFQDLLTGDNAFGTLIHAAGAPTVPSQQDPFPLESDPYFTGGYNTTRYTATRYSRVFGWQIETNRDMRSTGSDGGAAARRAFAEAFADAYRDYRTYVETHLND